MAEESHEYFVRVDWTHDRTGDMFVEGKQAVQVAAPPEFGGPEGVISPEDLFVAAAASCMMTTFVTFSKKLRFEYRAFICEAKGTLERLETGFQFTKMHIRATVTVDSEDTKAKAERGLELAGKYCLISNSMKCTTEHENIVLVE